MTIASLVGYVDPRPAAPAGVRVDDTGVHVRTAGDVPLVLSLEGRYLWAFVPARDGRPRGGGIDVPWPRVLRPFLDGHARMQVAEASSGAVLLDAEVRLGSGQGRIAVVDKQGRPLAVDKVGHLCRAFSATDDGIREEIVVGTQRALADLTEGCGVEAFLSYGALLGAVRDGAMIAHDSDTDVCYLSHHDSPADLILESYRIERVLRERGWRLMRMSGGDLKLFLPLSDGRQCQIDIFAAFRVGETFYMLGNRSGELREAAILPLSTIELQGHTMAAPARPAEVLAYLYGPGWRVPDPAFKSLDPIAGIRRLDGWLRGFRDDMDTWSTFYAGPEAARVPRRRSTFARWVHLQLPPGAPVADLGTGRGRDALWLARRGRPVAAYDFCRAVRFRLERRAQRLEVPVEARLLNLNELRSVLAAGAELAREGRHLYARQLLGCLDDRGRANLWALARMVARGGGLLYVEFSALAPRAPALAPAGLKRRLDPAVVRREIEASGGTVLFEELGPGEDMFDDYDPSVCRMRVGWEDAA